MIAFAWAILWLVIAVLFTWRVTSLIARERGPFAVGVRLRSLFGVYHTPDGRPSYDGNGELRLNIVSDHQHVDDFLHEIALGMTCMWCCSVWVSLFAAAALHVVAPGLVFSALSYLLIVGAMSGMVIMLEERQK